MSNDYVMLIFLSKDFRKYLDKLYAETGVGPQVLLNTEDFPTGEPYGVFSNVEACFFYLTNWYKFSAIGRIIREIKQYVKPVEYNPKFTKEEYNAYDRYFQFVNQNVFHIQTHINFNIKDEYKRSYIIKIKDLLQIDINGKIGEYKFDPVEAKIDMDKMFFMIEHTGSSFELFETAKDVLTSEYDWKGTKNIVYVSYLNRGCGKGSAKGRPNYINGTCSTITQDVLKKIALRESRVMTKDREQISSALGAAMNQPDDVGRIVEQFMRPAASAQAHAAVRRQSKQK